MRRGVLVAVLAFGLGACVAPSPMPANYQVWLETGWKPSKVTPAEPNCRTWVAVEAAPGWRCVAIEPIGFSPVAP
jgi:hypothetical protein